MVDFNILYNNGAARGASVTRDSSLIDAVTWGVWNVLSYCGCACTPVQVSQVWGHVLEIINEGATFNQAYRVLSSQLLEKVHDLAEKREIKYSHALHVQDWAAPSDGVKARRCKALLENDLTRSQERLVKTAHWMAPILAMADQLATVRPRAKAVKQAYDLEKQLRNMVADELQGILTCMSVCDQVMERDHDRLVRDDMARTTPYQTENVKLPGVKGMGLAKNQTSMLNAWREFRVEGSSYFSNGIILVADPPQYAWLPNMEDVSSDSCTQFVKNMLDKKRVVVTPLWCVDVRDRDINLICNQVVLLEVEGRFLGINKDYLDYIYHAYPQAKLVTDPDPLREGEAGVVQAFIGERLVAMVSPIRPSAVQKAFDGITLPEEKHLLAA